jgi:hypothetical protein
VPEALDPVIQAGLDQAVTAGGKAPGDYLNSRIRGVRLTNGYMTTLTQATAR